MRELYPGHLYELDHLDGNSKTALQFIQRGPLHKPIEGPTNQEVIRAIIARVKHLDSEAPWSANLPDDTRLNIAFAGQLVAYATFGDFRRARALTTDGADHG